MIQYTTFMTGWSTNTCYIRFGKIEGLSSRARIKKKKWSHFSHKWYWNTDLLRGVKKLLKSILKSSKGFVGSKGRKYCTMDFAVCYSTTKRLKWKNVWHCLNKSSSIINLSLCNSMWLMFTGKIKFNYKNFELWLWQLGILHTVQPAH